MNTLYLSLRFINCMNLLSFGLYVVLKRQVADRSPREQ